MRSTRSLVLPASRPWALGTVAFLFLAISGWVRGPCLHAGNGDVLFVSSVLGEATAVTDITFDSSANPAGGSFWVLGKQTGRIYHVSADLRTLLGDIPNPHGTGVIPNFILSWGVAYRSSTRTLLVLAQNQGKWFVKEVDTATGVAVPEGAFEIQLPPDSPGATLRGLAYDILERQLWYLDSKNERVVRTDLAGSPTLVVPLPRRSTDAVLRGEGLCVQVEEVLPGQYEPRIYVAYGDIFRSNPSRIIQLRPTGEPTGIEVPLVNVDLPSLGGFQTQSIGPQRRMVVVSSSGSIAQVEQVIPAVIPPSEVQCVLNLSNQVEIQWQNNGIGSNGTYGGEIIVLRNGVPFTTVPGASTSFTDTTPLQGKSSYALRASDAPAGIQSPGSFPCDITVGAGGIVSWTPFAGTAIYDVARDPRTGDIFVTDNVGVASQGRILHYDSNLQLVGEVPSTIGRPGPIAFVPSIDIQGVILENVLAVGRTDAPQLKIIALDGTVKTTLSLDLADSVEGGLTYLPATQQFILLEADSHQILLFSRLGRLEDSCVPLPLWGLPPMEIGLTYDGIMDTVLAVFHLGVVRELYSGMSCVPTGFEFALQSLGEGYEEDGFTGGIQIADNTMLIAGRRLNTLFRVLIFPYSPDFRRGDVDQNEEINITDAVSLANYLFLNGAAPQCPDAADTNDDGGLDVSDPIYLLFHLFLEGPPPPMPFPEPGMDPSFRDNLGC